MATTAETPHSGDLITAPAAVAAAARCLAAAADHARALGPHDGATVLIAVAIEWRYLAVALSQHQAMTPRPKDDDR